MEMIIEERDLKEGELPINSISRSEARKEVRGSGNQARILRDGVEKNRTLS